VLLTNHPRALNLPHPEPRSATPDETSLGGVLSSAAEHSRLRLWNTGVLAALLLCEF
jgi:hypothetical protein